MSEVKVNKISPRTNCGTTTLGDSGDTFNVPCGSKINVASGGNITVASGATITNNGTQTGFGRTGAVDWITTKKTGDFTAANGEGYFVDTGSGAVTATLPGSPAAGSIVAIKDYDGGFGANNCTVARNGVNIRGEASDFKLAQNNSGATFIYVDATEGWQVFADGSDADVTETFISATGGTTSNDGDFTVHKFTGPGTFTVSTLADQPANNEVSYLVVAGGGAAQDAGAGAGGYRERKSAVDTYTASPLNGATPITVTAQGYPITVGAGAPQSPGNNAPGVRTGNPSVFSTITSSGGGAGCTACTGTPQPTYTRGGSGGGQRNQPGGPGNYPPVSPAQGKDGGDSPGPGSGAAGGGGAITAGNDWPGPRVGGTGTTSEISGSSTGYAGGGSGAAPPASEAPREPTNTGGASRHPGPKPAPGPQCGVVNTGGGGGGVWCGTNGSGGSGVVIIRYKRQ